MFVEEKIDLVLQKIEEYQQFLDLFIPDLTRQKNVASFLGVSDQCMLNWLDDDMSPIKEKEHYVVKSRGNIEFIPHAIIKLKRTGGYKNRRKKEPNVVENSKEYTPSFHPMTTRILQKIGKIPSCEEAPKGDVL
jgi:hypothetical protein